MSTQHAIGLDLGGTNLRAAVVEVSGTTGRLIKQQRAAVGVQRDPKTVAQMLARLVRELDPGGTLPVGVGVAGMLRGTSGIVANAPNLGWRDAPFAQLAGAELGRPVWLENDLSAICWGEYRFGAARGMHNILCVFVGTGIGAGAVLEDRLFRGATNAAMEIGHVKVADGGRACGCGAKGCLEAYVGGTHLASQAREAGSKLLLELVDGRPEQLHAGHLNEACAAGCERSRAILEDAARLLGRVLANTVTLLNCDCLMLGGTVWSNASHLREVCLETFSGLTNAPAYEAVRVVEAILGDNAGMLGAADLGDRELLVGTAG